MKNAFIFLGVAALFASCASFIQGNAGGNDFGTLSMMEQWETGRFVTDSQDGMMVVVGVASRHVRREDEILAAKSDAARKVAMFHGMGGIVESFHRTGANFFDFIFDSQIRLEYAVDYRQFVDRLQFDPGCDVLIIDTGTLVRFRYPVEVTRVDFVGTMNADGRPSWLDSRNLPEIDGYTVAVGVSRNHRWLRDTVMRSTQASAARIIQDMSIRIQTTEVAVAGTGSVLYISTRSEGILDSFRVIEFWIDPGSWYVYTLGIARFVD